MANILCAEYAVYELVAWHRLQVILLNAEAEVKRTDSGLKVEMSKSQEVEGWKSRKVGC